MRRQAPAVPRPGQVLLCASLAATACFFSATAVHVLLPSITRDLGASSAQAEWVALAYWLSLSVLTLCFGRLADVHGRKRLFCGGLAVFSAAALAGALAPGAGTLVLLRLVQGAAAAAIFANTAVLVADAYRGPALGLALARLAMVAALAQALGPSLGGWLEGVLGWRSVFAGAGLLALGVLVAAVRCIAADPPPGPAARFDGVGALLSATGLGALCWGLTLAGTPPGGAATTPWPVALSLLAAGALSFALLWPWLLQAPTPLIAPDLLRDPQRMRLYACVFLMAMAQQGPLLVLAMYYQLALHWAAADVGWRLAALALGMVLGAPAAGRGTRYLPAHTLCAGALAGMAAFTLALAAVVLFDGHAWLVACLLGLGASLALFVTPCNQMLMDGCPPGHRGIVNALRASLQGAGGLAGMAWVLLLAQWHPGGGGPLQAAASPGRSAAAWGVVMALACVAAVLGLGACLAARVRMPPVLPDQALQGPGNKSV